MIYTQFTQDLFTIIAALDLEMSAAQRQAVSVEPPRDATHGDIATNAAMVLAKAAGCAPRVLAERMQPALEALPQVASVRIAGPGFINLTLTEEAWLGELGIMQAQAHSYGTSNIGEGMRANVEYVSANPTGPLHMGHCRGAVVGDALAAVLEAVGYKVIREYYVNDAGGQVNTLARSAHMRYVEALGHDIGEIPEGLYPGDYLKPVGQDLASLYGATYKDAEERAWLALFRTHAIAAMLKLIQADLAKLGIKQDIFASEAQVHKEGKPQAAESWLRARDLVYDGEMEAPKGDKAEDWEPVELPLFRSSQFGDDQDRPIRKSDGTWTYFGADMAYHFQKAQNADLLIDIWGADHAGTVKRIKAAVAALTENRTPFDIKLVQMVNLMRNGEPVKMSKRSGNFITLADVVEEVGKDVVRFTMLTRRPDAQMEFDFAKVVEASKDNPVFYVQYAHARIASLHRKAQDMPLPPADPKQLQAHELELIKLAAQYPRIIAQAASHYEPHRIAFYLYDMAAAFHSWYNMGNDAPEKRMLLPENLALTAARLSLAQALGQVIANGLRIMGVEPVNEM
jgi:arginyl-tRNA synthetase